MQNKISFAFFGGEPLAVPTLDDLYDAGLVPSLIISNPDKPQGRNMEIDSPPTAKWAKAHNIPLIQPEKLTLSSFATFDTNSQFDLFIVVSYGKIIPKDVLDLAKLGTINIHPSLLPLYRGPSPIVSAILNGDSVTGVSIIKIDEEMDHGPILAQEEIKLTGNELIEELEEKLSDLGGKLLVKILTPSASGTSPYVGGGWVGVKQDDSQATFCKKFSKEDAEIKDSDSDLAKWRKYRAYHATPRTFFLARRSLGEGGFETKRVIITDAAFENDKFIIQKVLPEGKKEITWQEFHRS